MDKKAGQVDRRRWFIIIGVIALLVVAGFVVVAGYLVSHKNVGQPVADDGTPGEISLESLRSIPYVSWTDEDADGNLSGVTVHDHERAYSGYNLYTNDVDQVYIMDMTGDIVHSWDLPGKKHCEYAEMLGRGEILVICVNQSVVKLDWSGNVIWEVKGAVNHDFALRRDGSFLISVTEAPRPYRDNLVKFDSLEYYSAQGQLMNIWSTFEELEALQKYHPPLALDNQPEASEKSGAIYEYYHLNTIEILPFTPLAKKDKRFQTGNVMLSLRNASTIVILDKNTDKPVWGWGMLELDFQHMPTMLPNGNILIFDNGTHRGFSRVIEINPLSKEIVWQYQADPPETFFSKWRGSNQRLANGNTLICDSESGRVFEVSLEGEVVWEYWNPELKKGKRKRIYRFMRVPEAWVDPYLSDEF